MGWRCGERQLHIFFRCSTPLQLTHQNSTFPRRRKYFSHSLKKFLSLSHFHVFVERLDFFMSNTRLSLSPCRLWIGDLMLCVFSSFVIFLSRFNLAATRFCGSSPTVAHVHVSSSAVFHYRVNIIHRIARGGSTCDRKKQQHATLIIIHRFYDFHAIYMVISQLYIIRMSAHLPQYNSPNIHPNSTVVWERECEEKKKEQF